MSRTKTASWNRREYLRRASGAVAAAAAAMGSLKAADAPAEEAPLPFAFREVERVELRLKTCLGLAIGADDRLYAGGEEGVIVFDAAHKKSRLIKTSGPVHAVAVDEAGYVYAGLRAGIEKYDDAGARQAAWGREGTGDGEFQYINALALAGAFLYVADGGSRRVSRYAVTGDYVDDIRQLVIPSAYLDVWVDVDGVLYVTHTGRHRVERYDENRKLLGHWGDFGTARDRFSGCCNPTNLAVYSDGRVATSEKGIPRLKLHDREGKLLAHLGSEAFPSFAAGMDLALDSKERLALLDPIGGRARFYVVEPAAPGRDGNG